MKQHEMFAMPNCETCGESVHLSDGFYVVVRDDQLRTRHIDCSPVRAIRDIRLVSFGPSADGLLDTSFHIVDAPNNE